MNTIKKDDNGITILSEDMAYTSDGVIFFINDNGVIVCYMEEYSVNIHPNGAKELIEFLLKNSK